MKRQLFHLVGWAFIWFCWVPLAAQDHHIQHYDLEQGLSDSDVADIHKDRFGYLWVATSHGLNQYNGHDFRIFRYDPEDSFSIRANSLGFFYEDPEANIWVTLNIGGVSKYDRYDDRFYYYTANPDNGADHNNFIKSILTDSQGRTWVGTSTHINLLSKERAIYEPVAVNGHDELYVTGIFEDKKGQVWLGSNAGLFLYNQSTNSFEEVVDTKGLKIPEVVFFAENKHGETWAASYHDLYQLTGGQAIHIATPSKRFITNMFVGRDDQIFISQFEDNLYLWNGEDWQIPSGFKSPEEGLGYVLAQGGMDKMLVKDNSGGYYIFNMELGSIEHLITIDEQVSSFWFGKKAKALWLGVARGGFYKIDLRPISANHILLSGKDGGGQYQDYVSDMASISPEKAVILSGGNLYQFDNTTKTGTLIQSRSLDRIQENDVVKIIRSAENELMMLTTGGMARLDLQSFEATRMPSIAKQGIHDFVASRDSLWSIGSYGLALMRISTKEMLYFRDLEYIPAVLKGADVRTIYQTRDASVWVGTVREGLVEVRFDRETGRFTTRSYRYGGVRKGPFKTHTVNALLEDSSGRLWVGGFSTGLLGIDRKNQTLINHTPKGELPIPHINAMVEAKDGAIWISALDGVHRFDPETKSFYQFGPEEGLPAAPLLLHSAAAFNDDLLAFGTEKGLTLFDPGNYQKPGTAPKVLLEAITVQNDGTTWRMPELEGELTLKYDQNFLSFDFIGLDYLHPDKVSYQYRLKGLQEDWKTINHGHVQYANLGPGTYMFEVRAGNEAGNWNEEPTQFSFYIHQPFWWQPWFLVLLALVVMVVVLVINRIRLNLKLSKVRALETIRQNAAADFHDEMGNKLTRISLFTEVLEKKLNGTSPEISSYVKKIKDNSHILNNSMRDFLWALDPEKDTAFDLIVLLKDFGDELFDNSEIHFHVASIKEGFREYPLDMDWKRHLVMIFKEAMHNALKYSEARKVTLKASLSKDVLNLSLTDDGVGFRKEKKNGGYGHANMMRRTEQLGASISIESKEGKGTVITFIGTLSKTYETYD